MEHGTEARTKKVQVQTHFFPTCLTRNGRWRKSSPSTCYTSSRSQCVLIISVNYILTFQAGLTVIEVGFKEEEEDDDPEPLRMEHFYFPFGALLIGLLLSVFCLIVEIICLRKSKTDVPRAVLEEPDVI